MKIYSTGLPDPQTLQACDRIVWVGASLRLERIATGLCTPERAKEIWTEVFEGEISQWLAEYARRRSYLEVPKRWWLKDSPQGDI